MSPEILHALVFWFPAFLFSVTAHEAAHAWAAMRGGDATALEGGQVSLNPLPHMLRSPVGMIVVPLVTTLTQGWTMGWASCPYDPLWAARHPRRAAWMAAAGPAANLLLALAAFGLLRAGLALGFLAPPESVSFGFMAEPAPAWAASGAFAFAGRMLSVLLMLNTLMFAFNLLPFPPLDGASAITLVLPARMAGRVREWNTSQALGWIGVLVAWRVFPVIAGPLFQGVVGVLYPGVYAF